MIFNFKGNFGAFLKGNMDWDQMSPNLFFTWKSKKNFLYLGRVYTDLGFLFNFSGEF